MTRRFFVLASVAFPLGCAWRGSQRAAPAAPQVRAPAVGQSWHYAKKSGFSGHFLATQIDQVGQVGSSVKIDSRSELPPSRSKSKAAAWLAQELGTARPGSGPLPGEVQEPWGSILIDPHWEEVQAYEAAIPLWPLELRPGWSSEFTTRYRTTPGESGFWWQQTMTAHAWESVKVPAGRFTALRFTNLINFQDPDPGRRSCVRRETVWFAPEVGRWVIRESSGTYYFTNSYDDTEASESSYRWELVSYS